MELACSFHNAKKGVSFDALLLSLPQSLWLTVLVRGNFYCLLMEQAAVSMVTPESIQPIGVWSIVRSETALVDVVTSKE